MWLDAVNKLALWGKDGARRLRHLIFGLTPDEEVEQMILLDIAVRGFWDSERAMEELEVFERLQGQQTSREGF